MGAHLPSRRLYAACSEFDEAKLFQASTIVFFQNTFSAACAALFCRYMAEQDCPAVYFKLPSAACAGMPYFLRRNYNRRKAKAALLLLTPRSTLKRRSYAAPPSQPVKGFRRQYAPHFYRQIAQEGTPRLSKRFFRRQPHPYNAVAPSESKRAHVPTLCRNTAVFFPHCPTIVFTTTCSALCYFC